mgnify:CR=1 FL=1
MTGPPRTGSRAVNPKGIIMTVTGLQPAMAVLLGYAIALLSSASPAFAQGTKCLPRQALVKNLAEKYHEPLTGGGLQNPRQLLEIWTSPETGSFTVFITRADGVACIVATVKHWHGGANSQVGNQV